MISQPAVLISGANGGVGSALCKMFKAADYLTIGTDLNDATDPSLSDLHIKANLDSLIENAEARSDYKNQIIDFLGNSKAELTCLINNAAIQCMGGLDDLSLSDFQTSLQINVVAPFMLVGTFKEELEATNGNVINIGSIHAQLTKAGFVAYATSKTAIAGLTRSLAVDLGGRIRVNCIEPAALDTPMLAAGFRGNSKGLKSLADCHPSGRIGRPEEVAALSVYLAGGKSAFINGATIPIDGGIRARLHDPV